MPNSDQFKYLKQEEKTPIPLRASRERKKAPEPIMLPEQPTFDERIKHLVRSTVCEMLYHIMRSEEQVNIVNMSFEEFDAFMARVLEDA